MAMVLTRVATAASGFGVKRIGGVRRPNVNHWQSKSPHARIQGARQGKRRKDTKLRSGGSDAKVRSEPRRAENFTAAVSDSDFEGVERDTDGDHQEYRGVSQWQSVIGRTVHTNYSR